MKRRFLCSTGNSLLCYGGNCCVQQWDLLCWVLKLSAAWDKGEGLRCVQWKILQSRWTVVLHLEWSVLQWTLSGRYFSAGGQWYCSLNGVCYSEHYVEDISQLVGSGIAAWMECVTVNIVWKILHSTWTVVLQLDWRVLQWTLYGRYFTAGGQWYCSLNGVRCSEHYMEDTAQQVDSGIAAWMECVTVNIIWKILHSRWAVV